MDIVITGYGAVSPFGIGVPALWDGLVAGKSAVREMVDLHPEWPELPVSIGAPVVADLSETLGRVRAHRLDRSQQLAIIAAEEAWVDAGEPGTDPDRLAVVVGTGIGGIDTLLTEDHVLHASGARRVSPRAVPMLMPNGASAQISIQFDARGGTYTPTSACTSGAEAIATGARMIRSGEADVVIAGGTEGAITPMTLAAFAQSQALAKPDGDPTTLSRPFDANRRGFVLGEGSGIVILESADHARARGARIHATLSGWGITSDAFHITAPEPSGRGQRRAVELAIRMAGLSSDDIDVVNAHATGTPIGDVSEALALEAIVPSAVVTAPKSSIGHLFGAAGAIEAIITARTVETGIVTPTLNLDDLDPAFSLDVVTERPRAMTVRAAVSNSFGFGGQNASLVIV
jgi:3-oxoacyl-[acyl-carrier-protein] synthase II